MSLNIQAVEKSLVYIGRKFKWAIPLGLSNLYMSIINILQTKIVGVNAMIIMNSPIAAKTNIER